MEIVRLSVNHKPSEREVLKMKKKARVKMYCTATVYINEDINGNQEIEEVEDVDDVIEFEVTSEIY